MPTSLQQLVRSRAQGFDEENLEQGRVWVYSPGTMYAGFCTGFCWRAPENGTAVIEVWGAGGSGALMCCCGGGTSGNAGAYAKRTISVATGCPISGIIGRACGNSSALCFRGCSEPSEVCWTSTTGDGCICAQGGAGGRSMCSTGTSLFCCFVNQSHCFTGPFNNNCGLICNYFSGIWIACAYGGDVNCCGPFSCTSFLGCLPLCHCCSQFHVAVPAGYFACQGSVVTHGAEEDSRTALMSGQNIHKFFSAMSGASRTPVKGVPMQYCWRSDRACGCYEMQGCMPYLPPGVGGLAATPCPTVRDHAIRGGMGAVRIRFYS
jgi:hypothetical protein